MIKIIIEDGNYKSSQVFDTNSIKTLSLIVNGSKLVDITRDKDDTISPKKRQMIKDELFKFDNTPQTTTFTQKDLDNLFADDSFWDDDKK